MDELNEFLSVIRENLQDPCDSTKTDGPTMTSVKQIFDFLPGLWNLSRRTLIPKLDRSSGALPIRANGLAAFSPADYNPNVLFYTELVMMKEIDNESSSMNGMEAKQKYKYQYDPDANTLTKHFSDDRLFYVLKPNRVGENGEHHLSGDHLCIEDRYAADYSFNGNGNQYTLKYNVNGPKKCYGIITEYQKLKPNELVNLGYEIVNGEIQGKNSMEK